MKFLPFILLVMLTACSRPDPHAQEIAQQLQSGDLILRAIDQYYVDTKSYPASLTNLVSAYLPRYLPVTTNASQFLIGWDYRVATNASGRARFTLSYKIVEYRSAPPEWVGYYGGQEMVLESFK